MNVGSLFSGIGGFDLGFERAGMRTVWFCEQDPYCQRVLARHWPGVPCYPDVRALVADPGGAGRRQDLRGPHGDEGTDAGRATPPADLANGGGEGAGEGPVLPVPVPQVDLLCGGFPCQDLSYAGKGAGIDGARSGLWSEFARLIGELRPSYVVVENVPAILGRGAGRVLGDLAALGFDAEWDCLPASTFGAPHRRDRFWLVAYPNSDHPRWSVVTEHDGREDELGRRASGGHVDGLRDEVADPDGSRRDGRPRQLRTGRRGQPANGRGESAGAGNADYWATEPNVGRVAVGVPARVDRLRSLGNSLVPSIAEFIGTRILEWEEVRLAA